MDRKKIVRFAKKHFNYLQDKPGLGVWNGRQGY